MWDLSSLTGNRTRAPCSGSSESYPLDHQGRPSTDDFKKWCAENFGAVECGVIRLFGKGPSGMVVKGRFKRCKFRDWDQDYYKNLALNGWVFKLRQWHVRAACWCFILSGDCFTFSECGKESVNSSIYLAIIQEKKRNIWKVEICPDCELGKRRLTKYVWERQFSKLKNRSKQSSTPAKDTRLDMAGRGPHWSYWQTPGEPIGWCSQQRSLRSDCEKATCKRLKTVGLDTIWPFPNIPSWHCVQPLLISLYISFQWLSEFSSWFCCLTYPGR